MFEGAASLHGEILERRFHGRRVVRLWTDDGATWTKRSTPSGMCRCRRISSATTATPIAIAIRRSSRGRADRSPRRRQACTSRRAVVAACAARGVEIAEITLHVGYGTFQPVRVEHVEDHRIEPERYEIGRAAADAINSALAERPARSSPSARRRRARSKPWRASTTAGSSPAPVRPTCSSIPDSRFASFGAADELSSAAIVAADAGVGLRRPRARARGVPPAPSPSAIGSTATATRC